MHLHPHLPQPFIYPSMYTTIHLPTHLSTYPLSSLLHPSILTSSIHPPILTSVHLAVHPSTHSSINSIISFIFTSHLCTHWLRQLFMSHPSISRPTYLPTSPPICHSLITLPPSFSLSFCREGNPFTTILGSLLCGSVNSVTKDRSPEENAVHSAAHTYSSWAEPL